MFFDTDKFTKKFTNCNFSIEAWYSDCELKKACFTATNRILHDKCKYLDVENGRCKKGDQ